MKFPLLFIVFFIAIISSWAQPIVLTNNKNSYDVSKIIKYSVDTNSNKGLEQITSNSTKWQSFKHGQTPNMGITKQAHWFTFELQNNSDRIEWTLNVDYPTLDSVSIFVCDTSGVILFSDVQGILTQNIHNQRTTLFVFSLNKNVHAKVYMRVHTSSILIFPVKISTPMAFSGFENAQRSIYMSVLGILLAAFLFNLILYSSSREKAYLFLSFSFASLICFINSLSGIFYEYIQFNPPILLEKLRFISAGLTYGLHTLFAVYYLNLKNNKILWRIEVSAISYFFLYCLLAGTGVLNSYLAGIQMYPAMFLFFVTQFSVAIYLAIKKSPMARYYLFSFSPFLISILLYVAEYNAWIETNSLIHNNGLFASAFFAILLTSALTEKMIKVKHETARADQLEIDKTALEGEIIQRKKAEKNLLESEIRFHSLFELSPLPITLSEFESGKIVNANLALSDLTGFQKENIVGKTTFEIGLIDTTERREILSKLSQNNHLMAFETIINFKGKPRITNLFMSLLVTGQEKFIITLISDITNQKDIERNLKELNLTKDKFLSIIAHDLVNPFHAMILYSKELKPYTSGNERAASYNTNLLLTAKNTYSLLQNLLTWARSQTNQISFNPQPINLSETISEIISYALNIAKSKQIIIINEGNQEIIVEADLQMINMVLRNIVSNSIKFSFNQSVVKIVSSEDENNVYISVIDNGSGMESQEIKKLFNPYDTVQRPGTSGETGTGLGLVICNEFVNFHGGSIQVESQPGKGSLFKVMLPKKQK